MASRDAMRKTIDSSPATKIETCPRPREQLAPNKRESVPQQRSEIQGEHSTNRKEKSPKMANATRVQNSVNSIRFEKIPTDENPSDHFTNWKLRETPGTKSKIGELDTRDVGHRDSLTPKQGPERRELDNRDAGHKPNSSKSEIEWPIEEPTLFQKDMAQDAASRKNTQHLLVREMFIAQEIEKGTVRAEHISTIENSSHHFTKILTNDTFEKYRATYMGKPNNRQSHLSRKQARTGEM
jgi:hypothetical protein